jgi:hypothetical protein
MRVTCSLVIPPVPTCQFGNCPCTPWNSYTHTRVSFKSSTRVDVKAHIKEPAHGTCDTLYKFIKGNRAARRGLVPGHDLGMPIAITGPLENAVILSTRDFGVGF